MDGIRTMSQHRRSGCNCIVDATDVSLGSEQEAIGGPYEAAPWLALIDPDWNFHFGMYDRTLVSEDSD